MEQWGPCDAGKAYGFWPEFTQRVAYEAYDVTAIFGTPAAVDKGAVLGFRLGPGPYCDAQFSRSYNATAIPLLVEVRLLFANGTTTAIATVTEDHPAKHAAAAILPFQILTLADSVVMVDWYGGETVHNDAAAAMSGWSEAGYDATGWVAAVAYDNLHGRSLTPALHDPIAVLDPIPAVQFFDLGGGNYTWAFPQNFAGGVAITVDARGFANTTLRVHGGELTDGKGRVINQLRSNTQVFWRLAGLQNEVVAPTFVFFGAQYFGVSGWPQAMAPPTLQSAVAMPTSTMGKDKQTLRLSFGGQPFVSTDAGAAPPALQQVTASAVSSLNTTLLSAIQRGILWSQVSNFQSLPSCVFVPPSHA